MDSNPKVSVFIASYNHARYLPECLDSILAQTYPDFEIVIVDDGSTDGSPSLLEDYQRRFPEKIRYSWHPEHGNWGVSRTSNDAIQKSRGEYLAWIGSDDAWYPDKLKQQVEQLDNDPALEPSIATPGTWMGMEKSSLAWRAVIYALTQTQWGASYRRAIPRR